MPTEPRRLTVTASCYRQFDADYAREIPAEGYGGWRQVEVQLDMDRTAVVVMHAWDTGTRAQYPGWYRAVEYLPRARAIVATVFPPLLAAVRRRGVALFHVVGSGDYYRDYPGYRRAVELAGPEPAREQIAPHPSRERLQQVRAREAFVGPHNRADVEAGFRRLDFPAAARPAGDEGIAETAAQLFALCRQRGVNHLLYAGFAINWCLLMSPGGMLDMSRHGLICSALRQAVTAVENKESARGEQHKEEALWRVALAFGFVFDVDDFVGALGRADSTHDAAGGGGS